MAAQLREVVVATDEYRRAMAGAIGVGIAETAVLAEILHRGPLPPSAFVKRLGMASASITALLDRLETADLARREPNPLDRRSVLVRLTARGHAVTEAMFDMFFADIYSAVREAEPEHILEFTNVLRRIADELRSRAADSGGISAVLRQRTADAIGTTESS